MAAGTLNDDFERRSFWQATMPALPDRAGRALPDSADVVVIGGGYAGINAARELAPRGVAVTLLEAHTLGWGASTRNGGIVHAGYKWSARELIERYGDDTGRALYQETLDCYQTREAAHRRRGHRLRLPRGRPPRARVRARRTSGARARPRRASRPSVSRAPSSRASGSARRSAPTRTSGRSSVEGSGLLHPGRYFAGLADGRRRAPARTCTRASGPERSGARPMAASWSRRRGAILARDVFVATNGYTDGVAPTLRRRVIPIGSYIIASEPLPEDLARELSPKGRSFFDTKNFLYYWHVSADRRMIFGGRACFMPTSIDQTAAILHKGLLEVHPQLADYRIEYAWGGNVGFTFDRMPHVGRTKDGVAYAVGLLRDRRRADDPSRDAGGGVAGRRRGPGPDQAHFPARAGALRGPALVPALRGEWFRLQDGWRQGPAPRHSCAHQRHRVPAPATVNQFVDQRGASVMTDTADLLAGVPLLSGLDRKQLELSPRLPSGPSRRAP